MTESNHFHVGPAQMFRLAWREYKERNQSQAERWRIGSEALLHSWGVFVQAVLEPVTWLSLRLYLERWSDLRWTWIKPGGYFYTRTGNKRKRIQQKLRPSHTITLLDKVKKAQTLYQDAMIEEGYSQTYWQDEIPIGYYAYGEGNRNDLMAAMLALSGMIYDGRGLKKHAVKIKHKPAQLAIPESKRWPWPRTVKKRLRALRRSGLLTQPDWREVRL